MDERKRFPVERMEITSAGFGGSIVYNPFAGIPPSLWYKFGIDLAPIDLGDDAPAPHLFGRTLQTTLFAGGIILPARRWTELDGTFGPFADVGDGSIYVSHVHNPVDVLEVRLKRLDGARFEIGLDVVIAFEHEGSGFADLGLSMAFEAEFTGIGFYVPQWTHPDKVRFPPEWRIPATFDDDAVKELMARFVDLDQYRYGRDGHACSLTPIEASTSGAGARR